MNTKINLEGKVIKREIDKNGNNYFILLSSSNNIFLIYYDVKRFACLKFIGFKVSAVVNLIVPIGNKATDFNLMELEQIQLLKK